MTLETMCIEYQNGGGVELRNKIAMTVYELIWVKARLYSGSRAVQEDLVQEGMIGVLEAVESYRIESGCKFTTHAVNNSMYKMLHYIARTSDLLGLGRAGGQKLQFILPKLRKEITSGWTHKDVLEFSEKYDFPYKSVVFALGVQDMQHDEILGYEKTKDSENPANQFEVARRLERLQDAFNNLAPCYQEYLLTYHLDPPLRPAIAAKWGVKLDSLVEGAKKARRALTAAMTNYEVS